MEEEKRTDLTDLVSMQEGELKIRPSNPDGFWTGMYIRGRADQFWVIQCPCGVTAHYPINGLPGFNTRHPCGNPDHWTIRWDDA